MKFLFITVGSTRFDSLIELLQNKIFLFFLSCYFDTLSIQYGNSPEPLLSELGTRQDLEIKFTPVEIAQFHQILTVNYGLKIVDIGKNVEKLNVKLFRFKSDILSEIDRADFIISHAGTGSILESLHKHKPILVVVNETLMDNHQIGNIILV
jgi:beta-1,4-N-acetylglucosaminyltransferase